MTFLGRKKKHSIFSHFAFISFVNENTALDVLRQHAVAPLTFQNRPIILAPAYKKPSNHSLTSRKMGEGTVIRLSFIRSNILLSS